MNDSLLRDFVSEEKRSFRFQIGKMLASSLTGFIFGVISATIIWIVAIYFYKILLG